MDARIKMVLTVDSLFCISMTRRGEIHTMLKTASAIRVVKSLPISPLYLDQNSLKFIGRPFLKATLIEVLDFHYTEFLHLLQEVYEKFAKTGKKIYSFETIRTSNDIAANRCTEKLTEFLRSFGLQKEIFVQKGFHCVAFI